MTVSELIDRYLDEGPATRPAKRESSWKADRGNLTHHVRPQLGDRLVTELTRSDIARMIKAVSDGETAKATTTTKARGRATVRGGAGIAARVLAATSSMLTWGVEHGVGKENPAKGVKLARRASSERFLSREEAGKAIAKLAELESGGQVAPALGAIIRLLLLTGARKTEIAGLRWSEVDLARKRLVLPPERTKAGGKTGERRIALSTTAVAVLEAQPSREGWAFPASRGDGHVSGVQKAWERVRVAAELPGVRLHDLRHSFASFAVADGASLFLVGKALGHADTRTTERYAHLTDDPLQELAEAAGRAFAKRRPMAELPHTEGLHDEAATIRSADLAYVQALGRLIDAGFRPSSDHPLVANLDLDADPFAREDEVVDWLARTADEARSWLQVTEETADVFSHGGQFYERALIFAERCTSACASAAWMTPPLSPACVRTPE